MNKPVKWTLIGIGIFIAIVIVGFFGSAIVMGIMEVEKDVKDVSKTGEIEETKTNEIAELEQKLKDKDKEIEDLDKELRIVNYQLFIAHEELDFKASESKELEQVKEVVEEAVVEEVIEVEEEAVVEEVEEIIVEEPKEEVIDNATLGEKNAAKKALDYLSIMSFSYSGLVEQLKYEGYSQEEAVYGVDKCGTDWNEQAVLKAKTYLDLMSFSRTGLIDQLEYEGFTRQQAEYGAQAVGF